MIIDSMTVGHFRCLGDCEVILGPYVAIVGANGVGKSTILEAVRFMLDPDFNADLDHLNVGRLDEPLSVTMKFSALTDSERHTWSGAMDGDVLEIRKTVERDASGAFVTRFFGKHAHHPAFADLYAAQQSKSAFNGLYKAQRLKPGYEDLPNVTNADDGLDELRQWEADHPEQCTVADVVLPAKDVPKWFAESFRIVYVPAVSPVEDALVGKQSGLSELVNQMLWPAVLARPELMALQTEFRERYEAIFPPSGSTELDAAQERINESLETFAPGTAIKLGWDLNSTPVIRPPNYQTIVVEDGASNDVSMKGHGVQRALVVSVLNALNGENLKHHATDGEGTLLAPTTILLVEEPELYQHPTRARHFARALSELANVEPGKPFMQVFLTTHSPYFVSMSDFDSIRLVRREAAIPPAIPGRRVKMATRQKLADDLRKARCYAAGSDDEKKMLARLGSVFSTEVREGFFADKIVLTEGGSDVAALRAGLEIAGIGADASGIAILEAGSKNTLDKLWLIFALLEIPTYMVFDGDLGKPQAKIENPRLLELVGVTPEEAPKTTVGSMHAVFEIDRETTTRAEFGPEYDRLIKDECDALDYDVDQGQKVTAIVASVYRALHAAEHRSKTLDDIVQAIKVL